MIPSAWTQLRYHAKQMALFSTDKQFAAVVAGRGSGKTELARRRIVRFLPIEKDTHPDPIYFYALPTFAQAKRVAWRPLLNLIPKGWIKGDPSISELRIDTIFGSTLYVVGMDKPERIEGVQWDGGVVDESSDQKPGVFDRSILPALSHRDGWCWRIGVPKRYGIGAEEFKNFWDKGMAGDDRIHSTWWPSEDILTPEQMQFAKDTLSEVDYNEQYCASWEDAGGAIFHSFRAENVDDSEAYYRPDEPIVVGSDFNVNPMCWTLSHCWKDRMVVFDEIQLRNTNTRNTLIQLKDKYGSHPSGWTFIGDAAGKARHTSASASDYIQIRNFADEHFPNSKVHYLPKNPSVQDRFAACNAMLTNAEGEHKCFISTRCLRLLADLKGRTYVEGLRVPDDGVGDMGHMSDAWGYVVHMFYDLKHELKGVGRIFSSYAVR